MSKLDVLTQTASGPLFIRRTGLDNSGKTTILKKLSEEDITVSLKFV